MGAKLCEQRVCDMCLDTARRRFQDIFEQVFEKTGGEWREIWIFG